MGVSNPASRIDSVDLNTDGSVTISGAFDNMNDYKVTLLHIWLAQQGAGGDAGVGLATDALAKKTLGADGNSAFKPGDASNPPSFNVKSKGAGRAKFRPGPAVVSAIAVVSPVGAGTPVVLEWSRLLTLPQQGFTEAGDPISSSQA